MKSIFIFAAAFTLILISAPIPYGSIAVVTATAFLAALDSSRIRLQTYQSRIANNPFWTFVLIFLFWIIFFPWYLWIRKKIIRGEVPLRQSQPS